MDGYYYDYFNIIGALLAEVTAVITVVVVQHTGEGLNIVRTKSGFDPSSDHSLWSFMLPV